MGLFDRNQQAPPVAQPTAHFTVDEVKESLNSFGLTRLGVKDTRLKVLITRIVHNGLPYLESISGGKPKGSDSAEMITTLDLLVKTMKKYIEIQDDPDRYATGKSDSESLMNSGYASVKSYHDKLMAGLAGSDLTDYQATADYLSGTIHTIRAT